jgi:hypothetical protein
VEAGTAKIPLDRMRLFGMHDGVLHKHASSFERTALLNRQFHTMPRITECRDSGAEQNRMNVQADSVDQAGREERLCQFATAHQTDFLARPALEAPHEVNCIPLYEFDSRLLPPDPQTKSRFRNKYYMFI